MSIRARVLAAAVALGIGLSAIPMAPAVTVAAPRTGGPCSDGWQRHKLPKSVRDSSAYEVLSRKGKPAWLVGGSNDGSVALRWKKGRWTDIDPANDGTTAFMSGVMRPDGSVWVVGNTRPKRGVMQPITGTISGAGWQAERVGAVRGDRVALSGVAMKGRERAWAVGTQLVKGRTTAYAVRWTGSAWQRKDPRAGSGESGLTAAASARSGDVWAVGWRSRGSAPMEPYIVRTKGSGWSSSSGAPLPEGIGVLTDVHFSAGDDGWAVGYLIPAGSSRYEPLLEHWDGSEWSLVPFSVDSPDSLVPRAVTIDAVGEVWVAGTSVRADGGGSRGFVAHRVDGSWRVDTSFVDDEASSELYSIAPIDGGVIVSGEVDEKVAVFSTCSDDATAATDAATATDDTAAPDAGSAPETSSPPETSGDTADPSAEAASVERSFLAGELALGEPVEPVGFRIRNVARKAGLHTRADTLTGLTADLDADGWSDVLYWNHGDKVHFYLGGRKRFRKGRAGAFGRIDRHGCSAADVDLDGMLDVFCSSGRERGSAIDEHELSLAPAADDGVRAPDVLGVTDPFGRGRAATFIQLDDDGRPDLFVTNSPDRGDGLPGTNRFFRNVDGRFVAAPEVGLDQSTGGWCAVAADIDRDGDDDLLHCVDASRDARDPGLRVYVNSDGRMRERSRALGIRPMDDIAAIAADMTGDGRTDIVQLSHKLIRVSRGTRRGFDTIFEAKVPFAEGVAAGDVNGDGALDLYVVTGSQRGNEPDFLLVNSGRGKTFTSVRIPQARSGSGAGVMALDYDGNGLTDFVVLNGRGEARGPTQLLASFKTKKKRR